MRVQGACIGTSAVWDVSSNSPTATNGTCPNGQGIGSVAAAVTAAGAGSKTLAGWTSLLVVALGMACASL